VTAYLDSSALVAAIVEDEPAHQSCMQLMSSKNLSTWTHALAEVFCDAHRRSSWVARIAAMAAELIDTSLLPRLDTIDLTATDMIKSIRNAGAGVRGGAIFDYLHLAAARRASAKVLYTLNVRHFSAIALKGDPKIERPV
jgi:predicted nucleic acid-binding protein